MNESRQNGSGREMVRLHPVVAFLMPIGLLIPWTIGTTIIQLILFNFADNPGTFDLPTGIAESVFTFRFSLLIWILLKHIRPMHMTGMVWDKSSLKHLISG